MSVVELFLLAICKTLKDMNKSYRKITKLLKKRFNAEGKISRFVVRSLISAIRQFQNKELLKNRVRVSLLINKPLTLNEKRLPDCSEIVRSKKVQNFLKQTYIPFFVPVNMEVFEKPVIPENYSRSKRFSRKSTLRVSSE